MKKKIELPEPLHPQGYTRDEMKDIAKLYSINEEKFFKVLGVHTGIMVKGVCLTFRHDVELTLDIILNNREMKSYEFD